MQAAQQLPTPQKGALLHILHTVDQNNRLTREQAIAELQALRAVGAFANVESLADKYARTDIEISTEDLDFYLHQIRTEWEQELDDLVDND